MKDRSAVSALERDDPLAGIRSAFQLPAQRVYLDGNSLGALPVAVTDCLQSTLQQHWGEDQISSWNRHGWIDLPQRTGEKIAPLIGAAPGQVICCDSISVNLFKLLASALALRPGRSVILSVTGNFPTDLYMAQGIGKLLGEARCHLHQVPGSQILAAMDSKVAAVMLSHVDFRSGEILPVREITAAAHAAGALVIWDLAHSAGVLPVKLDDDQVDFAVGCGYKYLNGGPGAPAFVYAARRHHQQIQQPLCGWMGHRDPFSFEQSYAAAEGIQQFLCGTPPVLSMVALDAALDVFADVSIADIRNKSIALGELFVELIAQSELAEILTLRSPVNPDERGSQLAWSHPAAYGLCQAWIEQGVTADFREPDLLRVGFSPLYNSFGDVWLAIERLRAVVRQGAHLDPRWQQRNRVT